MNAATSDAGALPHSAIERLGVDDLADALDLSLAAHWNQNADDWRTMLWLGRAFGIREAQPGVTGRGPLIASALVLPYGERFAWISMVLVRQAWRRRGLASTLMRHCQREVAAMGRYAVLDATPTGREVYRREGFVDTWRFARYRREAIADPASQPADVPPQPNRAAHDAAAAALVPVRPLRDADWPAIEALDAPVFGASRVMLLRTLAGRWPAAARVVEEANGGVRGFVLGRDGREAAQIGPLVATDAATARALIAAALRDARSAVYLDLLDTRTAALLPWLQQQGFTLQRAFTRMVHGATAAPGDPARLWLVAGPELG